MAGVPFELGYAASLTSGNAVFRPEPLPGADHGWLARSVLTPSIEQNHLTGSSADLLR